MLTFHNDKLALSPSHCSTLCCVSPDTAACSPPGQGCLESSVPPAPRTLLGPHSQSLPQDPLSSLERQFALQLQITEAAHRLCAEENLSRQVRRQRKHAALQEEKKLRELERCLGDRRRNSEPPPTTVPSMGRGEPTVLSCAGLTQRGAVLPFAVCFRLLPVLTFHISAIRVLLPGSTQTPSLPPCTPPKASPPWETFSTPIPPPASPT